MKLCLHNPTVWDCHRGKLLAVLVAAVTATGSAYAPAGRANAMKHNVNRAALRQFVQADDSDEGTPIPSQEIDKYIAVYAAMQRDHNLTVEQAASRQGLTLGAFRQLEDKIQRNPSAHDRVLKALREAAKARAGSVNPH
jgi:hypothetical protein